MTHPISEAQLVELALAASNFDERSQILGFAKRDAEDAEDCAVPVSAVERWRIDKMTAKLSAAYFAALQDDGTPVAALTDRVGQVLERFQRARPAIVRCPRARADLLALHAEWVPTYREALALVNPLDAAAATTLAEAGQPLANCVAQPFLALIAARLAPLVDARDDRVRVDAQIVRRCVEQLLQRMDVALTWALETDIKVFCGKMGIATVDAGVVECAAYLHARFADAAAYRQFFLRFPVLARHLAQLSAGIIAGAIELIERLKADATEVATRLLSTDEPLSLTDCILGKSDPHLRGRTVAILTFTTAQGLRRLVYKPRSVEAENRFHQLLDAMATDGAGSFATYAVVARPGYGWVEYLPSGDNHVDTLQVVDRIYRQLGAYLAIFYVLGGTDLHCENIHVAGGNAFIIDLETMLGVPVFGRDAGERTLADSVFRTGLLDWPLRPGEAGTAMRVSGYGGGESFHFPHKVPCVNARRGSLQIGVGEVDQPFVTVEAHNRVFLGNVLVQPGDHVAAIVQGFTAAYRWFAEAPARGGDVIDALLGDLGVRFINRATQIYASALHSIDHPKCLMDPLEVDLVFATFEEHPRRWDESRRIGRVERAALWRRDVPYFLLPAQGRDLAAPDLDTCLAGVACFPCSPLEWARHRIASLDEDHLDRQIRYIQASLDAAFEERSAFAESAIDYAQQLADRICATADATNADAPWHGFGFNAAGKYRMPIGPDLYDGSAGIALFLAYIDRLRPDDLYRETAELALAHCRRQQDRTRIGGFYGLGGTLYLLVHLHALWEDDSLLDEAEAIVGEIEQLIGTDRYFDILFGAAGALPALLALEAVRPGAPLACARACGNHLLRHAVDRDGALSWPPREDDGAQDHLTGFAHGAAGIGWALIQLGEATGDPRYGEAGRQAFRYEMRHFDAQQGDWPDLRQTALSVAGVPRYANAWCNGAAGIGLSRIDCWDRLGRCDSVMLQEALTALSATIRNYHRLGNDSLCHGRAGNAELLLRTALMRDDPALQMEVKIQARSMWQEFEHSKAWLSGASGIDVSPGLMVGLSGIGMYLLRLGRPSSIPSPLLLDPPMIQAADDPVPSEKEELYVAA